MATTTVSSSITRLLPNNTLLGHSHAGQAAQLSMHGINTVTVYPMVRRHKISAAMSDRHGNFEGDDVCRGEFLAAASGENERNAADSFASGRRGFLALSILLSGGSALRPASAEAAAAEDTTTAVPLEPYSDAKDGFKLLRPAPWNKIDKPGASIFFEDPNSRSNNIGVTVAPVRIASLDAFGTVDDIVQKLVKAEREKPSTKDIEVVNVMQKKLRDNTSLYSLEYTLDTTRGSKRVLTSVTVAAYKLYILSIVFADGPVAPASSVLNDALHQVLNSFELVA